MVKKKLKSEEYLFVDGYNIINSWDFFKEYRAERLEEARIKLIDLLVEYQVYTNIKVILVFDAHLVKGNAGTEIDYNGLKVVYTKELETADHYIERELDKIGRLKRVRVATSDGLEQQIILGRGGTRLSARELEMEVFGNKKTISKSQVDENEKNNIHFGKLDESILESLRNIINSREDN